MTTPKSNLNKGPRKIRSDAILDNMPKKQRLKLVRWFRARNRSFDEGVVFCRDELGVSASRTAVANFHTRYVKVDVAQKAKTAGETP